MKSLIALSLLLFLFSCGKSEEEASKEEKKNILRGTVSQVMNFIIPSAYAEEVCSFDKNINKFRYIDCFPKKFSKCDSLRHKKCAFMIGENGEFLANAPVLGNEYSIEYPDVEKKGLFQVYIEDIYGEYFRSRTLYASDLEKNIHLDKYSTVETDFLKDQILKNLFSGNFSSLRNKTLDLFNNYSFLFEDFTFFGIKGIRESIHSFYREESYNLSNYVTVHNSFSSSFLSALSNEDMINEFTSLNDDILNLKNQIVDNQSSRDEELSPMINDLEILDNNISFYNTAIRNHQYLLESNNRDIESLRKANLLLADKKSAKQTEIFLLEIDIASLESLKDNPEVNEEEVDEQIVLRQEEIIALEASIQNVNISISSNNDFISLLEQDKVALNNDIEEMENNKAELVNQQSGIKSIYVARALFHYNLISEDESNLMSKIVALNRIEREMMGRYQYFNALNTRGFYRIDGGPRFHARKVHIKAVSEKINVILKKDDEDVKTFSTNSIYIVMKGIFYRVFIKEGLRYIDVDMDYDSFEISGNGNVKIMEPIFENINDDNNRDNQLYSHESLIFFNRLILNKSNNLHYLKYFN